jgi:hypothetical protein
VRERERESEMMMMRGGERVKEFLRPFVDSRTWDLCVIWKLGDDPSRFNTLSGFSLLFVRCSCESSSAVYYFVSVAKFPFF